MVSQTNAAPAEQKDTRKGLLFALGAYGIWGSFPLIIHSLDFANPFEVVAWRIIFGLLLGIVMLTWARAWRPLLAVLKVKRLFWLLALSSALIYVNWLVYVIGVSSGHIVESSLGYFINPLVTVVLAVLFQREKLSKFQWLAVALGALAVTVLTVDYGHLPLIALTLAISFGFYGLVKSKIGSQVTPLIGYSIETAMLVPLAAVQLFIVSGAVGVKFGTDGFYSWFGLALFGFLTAIPLILFGSAAKNLPLAWVGFMQYLTPSIQFVLALTVFHEPMPAARWIGFGIVWLGLATLMTPIVKALLHSKSTTRN
jgi:chloramphenicol-sensitive protein RarD